MSAGAPSGAEGAPAPAGAGRRTRPRTALIVRAAVTLVVLALVAAVAWIAVRALEARDSLESAEDGIRELRASLSADPAAAPELAAAVSEDASRARALTGDWVWRAAEIVPIAGRNLTVVREIAGAVDDLAADALIPLAWALTAVGDLRPVDGALDIARLGEVTGAVTDASDAIQRAQRRVAALDASGTLEPVGSAATRLAGLLDEAGAQLQPAAEAARLAVPLLGGEGPRSYLVLFQNPAEANSLGGNPASMLLLSADQGRISISGSASSGDFVKYAPVPVPLDPNLLQVYEPRFPLLIQDIATRPHFPTMAELAKGYWERQFGGTVDAVVSFDPIALAGLLEATGPVGLPTGDTLTSDNAVHLLLHEVYERYVDPAVQDAFFEAAAAAIFGKLTSGEVEVGPLIDALADATEERRLLLWSARADEQALIAATPVSGILPSDNADSTTVGVYFDDTSVSKLDFFLDTAVSAGVQCPAPDSREFTVTFTLTNRITAERAPTLPSYVASGWLPAGQVRTEVYVLGPAGATFLDWSVGQPGLAGELLSSGSDLGRPVLRFATLLDVSGSTTLTARFAGGPGEYGPLEVATTPMVNDTSVTVGPADCAD